MTGGIVIIQTAFPGDVILTGGLVRSVREHWPDLPLAIVVRPDCESIAAMMDPELEVIMYDKRGTDRGVSGIRRMAATIAEGPWEHAIVPHRSSRSVILARMAGLEHRIGFAFGSWSLLHTSRVPYRRGIHEVERNHDLLLALASLDGSPSDPALALPRLILTPEGKDEASSIFERLGRRLEPPPFTVLAPGSIWPTKRWLFDHWVSLAGWYAQAGLSVVWIGSDDEREVCENMATASETGITAAGELSWQGTAALLSQAHVLVANDSAPVHLAGSVGCPTVALFGPTVPGFGFSPIGRGSVSMGVRLGCRPCRLHGGRHCPEGHFRCMTDLLPARVLNVSVEVIRSTRGL
ncbi:glycosyltransferase family 9 protein [Candidatus Zixiibacteriota bacterium]